MGAEQQLGLVADIGRHSVRFGLSEGDGPPRAVRRYELADHPTFTSALLAYLTAEKVENRSLPSALAVAGAARGDLINLTGSRWFISLSGIEAVLRARPRAINECAAGAMALAGLPSIAFRPLTSGGAPAIMPGRNFLVLSPSTGFGVSALVSDGDRLIPVASEAAHMRFAPGTPEEEQIVTALRRRGLCGSIEDMLAAGGLSAMLEHVTGRPGTIRAEDIAARLGQEPALRQTMNLYAGALGAVIGDLALAFGAWDGVFLIGPMMRALAPVLPMTIVMDRAQTRGAFRRQLSQLSLTLVLRDDLELLGAAALLRAGRA